MIVSQVYSVASFRNKTKKNKRKQKQKTKKIQKQKKNGIDQHSNAILFTVMF